MGKGTRHILLLRRRFGPFWNVVAGSIFVFLVSIVGIIGYRWIEGWNFIDSFYMVVISLSTVGFMEVQPLSQTGRLFTALFILGGVGGFLYIAAAFTQMLVEGRLQMLWGKRRMQKSIDKLNEHFIVCAASATWWPTRYARKGTTWWFWSRTRSWCSASWPTGSCAWRATPRTTSSSWPRA